jgi:dUTP pyrophosphatase
MSDKFMEVIVTDKRLLDYGLPQAQTEGSAGLDLRAFLPEGQEILTLRPGEQATVDSGLRIWIKDPLLVGIVLPRSSTGKAGVALANTAGVIDSDYQGPLKLCLWNRGEEDIEINNGDRVTQLLLMPVVSGYAIKQVVAFSNETERGSGGFGSTGKQ